jgi:hypothetical protein
MNEIMAFLTAHGVALGTLPTLALGFAARHYGPQIKAWLTQNEDLLVMRALTALKTGLRKHKVPEQTITQIEMGILTALTEAAKVVAADQATEQASERAASQAKPS